MRYIFFSVIFVVFAFGGGFYAGVGELKSFVLYASKINDANLSAPEHNKTFGGFDSFCSGEAAIYGDYKTHKKEDYKACKRVKFSKIKAVKVGYGAILLTNFDTNNSITNLSKKELFMALSDRIVVGGELKNNPYKFWNQINPKFPKTAIKIYGFDKNSYQEMVLKSFLFDGDIKKSLRNDGSYLQASGKFDDVNGTYLLTYSQFYNNPAGLKSIKINSISPEPKQIQSKKFPLSYNLILYVNSAKFTTKFIKSLSSPKMVGEDGAARASGIIWLENGKIAKNTNNKK